ncbi:hypothetical protein TOPH_03896 [Tolypocladium ophioglossoides CBS 100239]|uniref:Uncharacterized protein n=1 Tax=Tolypocladium ophioglossoides (strain CBS 100239) TaxID=1163406 RepID=A0A0L0NCE7_TOLOC|nr:hypothetical protein TOPH_03896 [Tolypocladium ophioglossoides CBS 100239]
MSVLAPARDPRISTPAPAPTSAFPPSPAQLIQPPRLPFRLAPSRRPHLGDSSANPCPVALPRPAACLELPPPSCCFTTRLSATDASRARCFGAKGEAWRFSFRFPSTPPGTAPRASESFVAPLPLLHKATSKSLTSTTNRSSAASSAVGPSASTARGTTHRFALESRTRHTRRS